MSQIVIALMSGPQDGAVLNFENLLDVGGVIELTIGRRDGSDICLNYDSQVSRDHARLIHDGVHFWLEDNKSTNGTYVENQRIKEHERVEVVPGQMFRVGRTWLRIEPIARFELHDTHDLPF